MSCEPYLEMEYPESIDYRDCFVLTGDHVYIKVKNIYVYVSKADEGVVVDVYDEQCQEVLTSTWLTYDEAIVEEDECCECGSAEHTCQNCPTFKEDDQC